MNNKKRQLIASILGVISLILLTVGVTYAVFTYTKLGSTENTVTAGTLKFIYTENTGVGAGISITNALPVSDENDALVYNTTYLQKCLQNKTFTVIRKSFIL